MSNFIFRRPELAQQLARQLLEPGPLDAGLRSGVFLSGPRRIGKTTFLRNDLIPELEKRGALVIYVDLWADVSANPVALVHDEVRKTLRELRNPKSILLRNLSKVKGVSAEAFGFKFDFDLDKLGETKGPKLLHALVSVASQAPGVLILIVDEVQHALTVDGGEQLLRSLKAARDAINQDPKIGNAFVFIGVGSHRSLVRELTMRRQQAFVGATVVDFPLLGQDYVAELLSLLKKAHPKEAWPSQSASEQAFEVLGSRPEELIKALVLLRARPAGSSPDRHLPLVALTQRQAIADAELRRIDDLGALARAVFDRIASDGEVVVRGVFSKDAAVSYSKAIGRRVAVEEIQPAVRELVSANLVMRQGEGAYCVSDAFVRETWRRKKAEEAALAEAASVMPAPRRKKAARNNGRR
jgi:hypothetical protein